LAPDRRFRRIPSPTSHCRTAAPRTTAVNSTTAAPVWTAGRVRSGARGARPYRTSAVPAQSAARAASGAGPRGARSRPGVSSRTAAPRGVRCWR